VKESFIDKYENSVLRSFGHVERMDDERIAKQVLNGIVEGVRRGTGRLKDSWMVVVDKCLKNKNVGKHKRKCQKKYNECGGSKWSVKDRVKWRAICRVGKK
jgi:hypothetical protein